jgi:hypothetical protein
MRAGRVFQGFSTTRSCPKSSNFQKNGIKNEKNSKKAVETRLLPLTKLSKRRKVDGGRLFQTPHEYRVFNALTHGNPKQRNEEARNTQYQHKVLGSE